MNRLRTWREQFFRPGEIQLLVWSTAWFFCLLGGYYQLRPLREAEAFARGSDEIPWLFLASFLAMLVASPIYASVANRGRGMRLVSRVYRFFELNLLVFFFAMQASDPHVAAWVGRFYFVWLSVFNLFVVSLMWSVFTDSYQSDQAKRLFGFISAGGTIGGIAGSAFASWLSQQVDVSYVLIAGIVALELCQQCGHFYAKTKSKQARVSADTDNGIPQETAAETPGLASMENADSPNAGPAQAKTSMWVGVRAVGKSPYLLGLCVFLLTLQACATTVYCEQADFIREAGLNKADRFALMSQINLWVLSLTLAIQLLGTAALLRRLGMAIVLGVFPMIYVIGFAGLAFWPSLHWIVALVVVHRAASYSVFAPGIQVLYTVVDRRTLYQAKGFLDTAVVRGGDVMSAQLFGLLRFSGLSLTAIAAGFLPLAVLTGWLGMRTGRQQAEMQRRGRPAGHD
ncbi:transport facilitation [Rhodopirellula islandica]|uniref:Transport facilitation n=1 Tax=Rhodopirellula islandica TaxID=595434 RepID=A0A0J1BBG9_RHOIS|nr:MFS transporter [Rhodopirellula islandica]KLU03985.1 transport facilitation [Rhodopirellula islandica]